VSIVCVKVSKKVIEMASDSILVSGWTQSKSSNSFAKLTSVNGMVIGTAGGVEEGSLFQVFAATTKPEAATESAVLIFMSSFAEWKHKKINKTGVENSYLLAFDGKAFEIEGFFVQEITTFSAIGAGSDFALTALHLGHDVKKAVAVACEMSVYCEQPVRHIALKR